MVKEVMAKTYGDNSYIIWKVDGVFNDFYRVHNSFECGHSQGREFPTFSKALTYAKQQQSRPCPAIAHRK